MTRIKEFSIFLLLVWLVSGCTQAYPSPIPHQPEIDPYITFLRSQKQAPVDYLLGLFDHYDIVIVSERAHPETTQYDLFYQLVSEKRFIDKVSSIFMEIGSSTLQPEMDDLLLSKTDFSSVELDHRIAHIGQNIGYELYWEMTNYYEFIRKLYDLNRTLPADKKIRVYPSNVPFSWEGMTPARYQDLMTNTLSDRDKIMADQIIANFNQLVQSTEKRKKALVIMNYRHGFNNALLPDDSKADNTGRYLMDQYPQVTANVMMNTVAPLPASNDQTEITTPIQDGRWDAAFAVLSNPNLGFDFKDTPFGRDSFDLFPFPAEIYTQMKYQDVFTGFVFYKPLKDHVLSYGVPGLYNEDEFTSIFYPHTQIAKDYLPTPGSFQAQLWEFSDMNTIQTSPYDDLDQYKSKINAWLLVTNAALK